MNILSAALDSDTTQNIITVISALAAWLVGRFISNKKDDEKTQWQKALEAASSIMEVFAHGASPDMTAERFEIQCRGIAAIQLAKFGYNVDKLPFAIAAARDAAVYAAMRFWSSTHPEPQKLVGQLNGLLPK
jgi:hypothetical protein